MKKRLDTIQKTCKNSKPLFLPPLTLMLPTENKYANAGIDELIFLSLEQQVEPIYTEEQIALWIRKITGGKRSYVQNYISKRIKRMNSRHIAARDHIWSISKEDGRYVLINIDDTLKKERAETINGICFDRSTFYRNDIFHGTVFGFKILATEDELSNQLIAAEQFFREYIFHAIFSIIKHDNLIFVLLDSSNTQYTSSMKRFNTFIDEEFLLKQK